MKEDLVHGLTICAVLIQKVAGGRRLWVEINQQYLASLSDEGSRQVNGGRSFADPA